MAEGCWKREDSCLNGLRYSCCLELLLDYRKGKITPEPAPAALAV